MTDRLLMLGMRGLFASMVVFTLHPDHMDAWDRFISVTALVALSIMKD